MYVRSDRRRASTRSTSDSMTRHWHWTRYFMSMPPSDVAGFVDPSIDLAARTFERGQAPNPNQCRKDLPPAPRTYYGGYTLTTHNIRIAWGISRTKARKEKRRERAEPIHTRLRSGCRHGGPARALQRVRGTDCAALVVNMLSRKCPPATRARALPASTMCRSTSQSSSAANATGKFARSAMRVSCCPSLTFMR